MFLFLILFLFLQVFSQSQSNVDRNIQLRSDIRSILEEKDTTEISLNILVNFEWDKAFLFIPYTSYMDIEETIGTKFMGSTDQFIGEYYLLIFLNNDKVVHYVELPYEPKLSIEQQRYLTPTDDLIKIERE